MSQAKIYVGNLSYQTSEDQLREHFSQFGSIEDLKLIIDFETGRSKGFAFITFASEDDSKKAIQEANGTDLDGRNIVVNAARENKGGSDRRGGGGGRGGNNGGGRRW